MKNIFRVVLISLILGQFSACTKSVYVKVMKPAPYTVPQNIKTIALVNRTEPKNKTLDIVESIVTGEALMSDREGAMRALDGIYTTMQEYPRFNIVRTNLTLRTKSLLGSLPNPMSWDEVRKIAADNHADAVLAIELFDTDFIVTHGSKQVEKKDSKEKVVKVTVYYAEGVAKVKMGVRLYNVITRSVIDEYIFENFRKWDAEGSSIQDAIAHLVTQKYAIEDISNFSGAEYARRICPLWTNVKRSMYTKSEGNEDMKAGTRKADVGDWNGAKESWMNALTSGDIKTKGRAAYNIALAEEIDGRLENARFWASKAYTEFGNKSARNYVNILNRRIEEEKKLEQQLKNSK